jgi:hypothetical protein
MIVKSDSSTVNAGLGSSILYSQPISRRSLLAGAAFSVASIAWGRVANAEMSGVAATPDAFISVSRAITARSDLSPVTASRIYAALLAASDQLPAQIAQLGQFAQQASTPDALKQAATTAGLGDVLMAIVTAWYTGTVETTKGTVVVSYAEALMYRPVADGLTVPTYCNKGPLWWTGLPPEITTMPVNNPKVL